MKGEFKISFGIILYQYNQRHIQGYTNGNHMLQKKGNKITVGVTIEGTLFEDLERARRTDKGRIPRNEFIKTAITNL